MILRQRQAQKCVKKILGVGYAVNDSDSKTTATAKQQRQQKNNSDDTADKGKAPALQKGLEFPQETLVVFATRGLSQDYWLL